MTREILFGSRSFSVYKSNLWQASKELQSGFVSFSVTLGILCRACLRPVCAPLTFSLPLIPGLVDDEAEASHVVREGKLKRGCFVRLKSFQANEVKGKK